MKTGVTFALLMGTLLLAAACANAAPRNSPATGTFQAVGAPDAIVAPKTAPMDYRLGAFDKIGVRVFQMDELSLPEAQLDAQGQIIVPQIGTVHVGGLTAAEAGKALETKLSECCLKNPQVIVTLREALSQQVTVMGAVKAQGVITLRGKTTLQSVVAMAGGPQTETADMRNVLVLRSTNGQRTAGRFNLQDINRGLAADPEILAGDTVVVETSGSKSAYRTMLQAIPLTGLFVLF